MRPSKERQIIADNIGVTDLTLFDKICLACTAIAIVKYFYFGGPANNVC